MFTNFNPIIALWLTPVVLQIALPLAMLAGWSITKAVQNVFIKIQQIGEKTSTDGLQAMPSV